MNHFTLPRRAAWMALLALGLLAAVAGCAKKVTSVDAGYTTLEGRPDANTRLLAWVDTPDTVLIYRDTGTPGPSPDPDAETDTLYDRVLAYRTGPGVIHSVLLDGTAASGFQFYRLANNGGLQALTDYVTPPSVKWLSSNWEMYSISDSKPSAYSPPTYVARGLLEGKVTTLSPVSNAAIAAAPLPLSTIRYTGLAAPTDSLFRMSWTPVAGAAGYWIHVYQFQSAATLEDRRASGTPNPVIDGPVKHIFVGYVAGASNTTYKLGGPGAEVMTFVTPIRGQSYYVRVTAVDTHGNVVAWMHGDSQLHLLDGFYEYIPLGAALVSPHR